MPDEPELTEVCLASLDSPPGSALMPKRRMSSGVSTAVSNSAYDMPEMHATDGGPPPEGAKLAKVGRWEMLYGCAAVFLTRPGDTKKHVDHKVRWLAFLIVLILANAVGYAGTLSWPFRGVGTTCLSAAVLLTVFAVVLGVRKNLDAAYQCACAVVIAANITLLDLFVMPTLWRLWALFVLLVDMLLVVEAPKWLSAMVVAWVCIWLALAEVEYALRFGMLDLPGMHDYAARTQRCECDRPPCAFHDGTFITPVMNILPQFSVFLMDFVLTRGFWQAMRREERRIETSIAAAEYIAAALARFDLETSERHLAEKAEQLPQGLLEPLRALLANLGSYKPFLPEELFTPNPGDSRPSHASHASLPSSMADVPGLTSPHVAILFTDVRQSTALWSHSSQAMKTALEFHSATIREENLSLGGYEVKTIGDAFMLAFGEAIDAVTCGLNIQSAFMKASWPVGLTRGEGDSDGFGIFSTRIGMHFGEVVVERNVLTGRYDYFGSTVNKASRVESLGVSWAVTVSEDVLDMISGNLGKDVVRIPYKEPKMAKGLLEPLHLHALLPRAALPKEARVREVCEAIAEPDHEVASPGSTAAAAPSNGPTMRAAHASVGVVRFADSTAAMDVVKVSTQLAHISGALKATGGLLSTVVNSTAVVSWGLYRHRTQHLNESARFITCLYSSCGGNADSNPEPFYSGLAAGPLAGGSVRASTSSRFVTLLGPCVDIAAMLCTGAEMLGTCTLLASTVSGAGYNDDVFLAEFMRPVDEWYDDGLCAQAQHAPSDIQKRIQSDAVPVAQARMSSRPGSAVTSVRSRAVRDAQAHRMSGQATVVYELRTQALVDVSAGADIQPEGSRVAPKEWSKWQYWRAYFAKDLDTLRLLSWSDPTISKIAHMLETGTHLPHPQGLAMRSSTTAAQTHLGLRYLSPPASSVCSLLMHRSELLTSPTETETCRTEATNGDLFP